MLEVGKGFKSSALVADVCPWARHSSLQEQPVWALEGVCVCLHVRGVCLPVRDGCLKLVMLMSLFR